MSVVKKEPNRSTTGKYEDIVGAALAERGDWFSTPNVSTNTSGAHTEVYRKVGFVFAEVSVDGDEVFLRIRPESEVRS